VSDQYAYQPSGAMDRNDHVTSSPTRRKELQYEEEPGLYYVWARYYGRNPGNMLRLTGKAARDAAFSTTVSISNEILNGAGNPLDLLKGFVPFINTFGANGTLMSAYKLCR
jgi:hypothetical protein